MRYSESTYLNIEVAGSGIPPQQPNMVLPTSTLNDCCGDFSFKVLATEANADEFQNDKSGIIFYFGKTITAATLHLEKFENGTFVNKKNLTNNDMGTFFAFNFFQNTLKEKFIAYILEWKKVLTAYGEGSYRVKANCSAGDMYTREFCLKKYTASRAEGTVRVEYYLNDILGDPLNDSKYRDFGDLNFIQQFRFNGFFSYKKDTYEKTYVQYKNGNRIDTTSEQEPEYFLELITQPFFVHELIRLDAANAEYISVTDFNTNNITGFVNKKVQLTGEYAPDFHYNLSKLANVELTLRQYTNNLKKYKTQWNF